MNVTTAKLTLYPNSFPAPMSVTAQTDYGVVRSDQPGFAEQVRNRSGNLTALTISFRMSIDVFHLWAPWIDFYATTRWCLFPVPTQYHGVTGDDFPLTREVVRFGNIQHNTMGNDIIDVTAEAELLPLIAGAKGDIVDDPEIGGPGAGEVVPPPKPDECEPYVCDAYLKWSQGNNIATWPMDDPQRYATLQPEFYNSAASGGLSLRPRWSVGDPVGDPWTGFWRSEQVAGGVCGFDKSVTGNWIAHRKGGLTGTFDSYVTGPSAAFESVDATTHENGVLLTFGTVGMNPGASGSSGSARALWTSHIGYTANVGGPGTRSTSAGFELNATDVRAFVSNQTANVGILPVNWDWTKPHHFAVELSAVWTNIDPNIWSETTSKLWIDGKLMAAQTYHEIKSGSSVAGISLDTSQEWGSMKLSLFPNANGRPILIGVNSPGAIDVESAALKWQRSQAGYTPPGYCSKF